jgi:serine/threonine protein kinase
MPLRVAAVRSALADRFEILRLLGSGGMAHVFAAREQLTRRMVAVKVLRPEFAVTILSERFHQEIAFLTALDHPNILPLLASGQSDHFIYYAMPFATGGSLKERLQRERGLPLTDAFQIARQLAAGIDYAHAHNVIHRDIKPENVMFEEGRPMLCDFGVARAIVRAAEDRISSSGLVVGTPSYMSPEQASGEALDHRTDVYALACVVYEMLAGEPPFTGATPQAVFRRQIADRPPSLRVVRPDLPKHVEEAVLRGLAKDMKRRWETGGALVGALGAG